MNKALTIIAETLREEVPLNGGYPRTSVVFRTLIARKAYKNRRAEPPRCLDKKA